ncbi:CPBP family intramembrane glutamic endopeptidase [Pseudomonas sp. BGI-2]|uniref:CPBP family intramembrane glutamic endopeptidase n=1 Tax=Pseudomonas sp. BGI-2 TaxID=2528211 RepID=UPI0010354F66|nr:CPBP family intramembrane glutamic endopeptidase [Pseudomonas sp. BGI-2]TBN34961.1 CPBP family intramembrane metalloprotease [Pseudomonas sp. BGI-2]
MKFENIPTIEASRSEPYKWAGRWGMAALAVLIFYALQITTVGMVGQENWNSLWLVGAHGITGAALLLLALIQFRNDGGIRALLGHNTGRALRFGVPLIVAAYVVTTFLDVTLGFGREPFMENLLSEFSTAQIILFLSMLLVLPPLSEELLYRHFLIRLFPITSRSWQWVAVIAMAALFMLTHGQYKNWPSFLLLGCLGVIFGAARIATGGLVAPVLLHSFAEVAGMTSDLVLANFE